jgi:hypothetical protein
MNSQKVESLQSFGDVLNTFSRIIVFHRYILKADGTFQAIYFGV